MKKVAKSKTPKTICFGLLVSNILPILIPSKNSQSVFSTMAIYQKYLCLIPKICTYQQILKHFPLHLQSSTKLEIVFYIFYRLESKQNDNKKISYFTCIMHQTNSSGSIKILQICHIFGNPDIVSCNPSLLVFLCHSPKCSRPRNQKKSRCKKNIQGNFNRM